MKDVAWGLAFITSLVVFAPLVYTLRNRLPTGLLVVLAVYCFLGGPLTSYLDYQYRVANYTPQCVVNGSIFNCNDLMRAREVYRDVEKPLFKSNVLNNLIGEEHGLRDQL